MTDSDESDANDHDISSENDQDESDVDETDGSSETDADQDDESDHQNDIPYEMVF